MTTNSIHNALINGLLADATYVNDLLDLAGTPLVGPDLIKALSKRPTPDLAKYLADHFEVVTQKLTADNTQSGFDVTVFKSKDDGQVYVSMRGSAGWGDFRNDGFLTLGGLATEQVIDMVNWWLKAKAPVGTGFTLASLAGESFSVAEGSGKTFSFYLNQAAKAGDTVTLALSGQADKIKVLLNNALVNANGAVITLVEGQSEVRVALVQVGELTQDASTTLSATYNGEAGTAVSNVWAINLKDASGMTKIDGRGSVVMNREDEVNATYLVAVCAYSMSARVCFCLENYCAAANDESWRVAA